MAGILFVIYAISWILSGGGAEKHNEKFKQNVRTQQEQIK
jgi:hypothetical protein